MTKKSKWKKIEIQLTPFGMGGGNYVLQRKNYYFSYNPCVQDNIFDSFLDLFNSGNTNGEETALCIKGESSMIVLSGDFRKEAEQTKSLKQAREKWIELSKKHSSPSEKLMNDLKQYD